MRLLRGVGPSTEKLLQRLGLHSIRDLLLHLPIRHIDRSHIVPISTVRPGQECVLSGTLGPPTAMYIRGRRRGASASLTDESGSIRCVWFTAAPWVSRWSDIGRVIVSGRASRHSPLSLLHPQIEELGDERDPYVPVYGVTEGLSQRRIRSIIRTALDGLAASVPSLVPTDYDDGTKLPSLTTALRAAHYPSSPEEGRRSAERVRLEALIPLQVVVLRRKALLNERSAPAMTLPADSLAAFLRNLPFTLTRSQADALVQIRKDLASSRPMHRLLQGDVGSGKTVVAVGACIVALTHGYQAALMAPTEVLADQHARVITPWIRGIGHQIGVLTGASSAKQRRELHESVGTGDPLLMIGTHALLQESVHFRRLGVVIVDEQHRFGIAQRACLAGKGQSPHMLVMTATPIPRSLAMTVYGHLDVSVLSDKPTGRKPIRTAWYDSARRTEALKVFRDHLDQGTQGFVVAPLVEEAPNREIRGAIELHRELSFGILKGVPTGLVHGRMPAAEKDRIIEAFRAGEFQVLVCTTVVEVGLDAPGAGVLLVDGAERFGLSQLHQLRGRIGRGGQEGLCLLLTGQEITVEAERRINAMLETADGFCLAELDLAQRGPGALLGPAQHGMIAGALTADPRLVAMARACALRIMEQGAPPEANIEALLTEFEDASGLGAG
ncbi:ATP-dependent DNA helicase RecG [Candidatus Fermentibacteria bacterium]|nr:ATP-dependent DNA helicase RecG [Candidatus Fermentibacteria bacterium]